MCSTVVTVFSHETDWSVIVRVAYPTSPSLEQPVGGGGQKGKVKRRSCGFHFILFLLLNKLTNDLAQKQNKQRMVITKKEWHV